MYQAFPALLPCNDDLHSDFRTRGLFGRNSFGFPSAEYLRPRARTKHRICLHFSSMPFCVERKREKRALEVYTITLCSLNAVEYGVLGTVHQAASCHYVVVREQINSPNAPDHLRTLDDCLPINKGRGSEHSSCVLEYVFGINCSFHASATCFDKLEEQANITGHANRYKNWNSLKARPLFYFRLP